MPWWPPSNGAGGRTMPERPSAAKRDRHSKQMRDPARGVARGGADGPGRGGQPYPSVAPTNNADAGDVVTRRRLVGLTVLVLLLAACAATLITTGETLSALEKQFLETANRYEQLHAA